jgi:hypothetical protein
MFGLIFERTRATVPEEDFIEDCIENGGSISCPTPVTSTNGDGLGIGESEGRIMTSGATDGASIESRLSK